MDAADDPMEKHQIQLKYLQNGLAEAKAHRDDIMAKNFEERIASLKEPTPIQPHRDSQLLNSELLTLQAAHAKKLNEIKNAMVENANQSHKLKEERETTLKKLEEDY